MSTRHGLLALLARGPRHGSRLRAEFEARTGGAWPLGVGQVRTALARLERDGAVVQEGVDEAGHALYALTEAGRAELRAWFARPVERAGPPRDELAVKLALAVGAPCADVQEVVEAQRRHVTQALHEHVRQRAEVLSGAPGGPDRIARLLVLEQRICDAEAEVRRLDHCEARVLRLTRAAEAGE
ncbi:helix-turn-helix transcriptional regulator [Streptomyces sp. NPDC000987]|uniref:PadR family transcriptional regulator n=1 Tax=Streptomyces sp. NPDC000987 TaxID=3154374 RepID=UPI00331C045D